MTSLKFESWHPCCSNRPTHVAHPKVIWHIPSCRIPRDGSTWVSFMVKSNFTFGECLSHQVVGRDTIHTLLRTYPVSPFKGTFEDVFPVPKLGYVSSLEGRLLKKDHFFITCLICLVRLFRRISVQQNEKQTQGYLSCPLFLVMGNKMFPNFTGPRLWFAAINGTAIKPHKEHQSLRFGRRYDYDHRMPPMNHWSSNA